MADVIVALAASLVLAFVVAGPKARRAPVATPQATSTANAAKR